MTDPIDTPDALDTDTVPTEDTPAEPDQPSTDNPSREAAKWRNRFRDAETELATMRERVEALQRGEAERLAAPVLYDAADMWRDGTQLADLLDDDGNIDPDKVTAAATKTADAHNHWKRKAPAAAPASEVTSTANVSGEATPTFSDAFKPRSG